MENQNPSRPASFDSTVQSSRRQAEAGQIPAENSYVLSKNGPSAFWQGILLLVDRLAVFLSLRKANAFWGVVYDSVSKQPLDPAIVKLLYTDGREIETCVTDLGGRYGFLAKPGVFKIFVRKTNYIFPSKYAAGSYDGIYEHIYHGEFFTLQKSSEVLAPNIPMDPIAFDWNQRAKQKVVQVYAYWKLLLKRLLATAFWFGLLFVILDIWQFYPAVPPPLYLLAIILILIILFSKALPRPRLWGRLSAPADITSENIYLELHSVSSGVAMGKAQLHDNGRFLLRAGKGRYLLSISLLGEGGSKVFLASMPVKVGNLGVTNLGLQLAQKV